MFHMFVYKTPTLVWDVLLQDRLEVANKGLNTSEKEKNKQKSMIGYKEQKN